MKMDMSVRPRTQLRFPMRYHDRLTPDPIGKKTGSALPLYSG
jgi:hypothetical protein